MRNHFLALLIVSSLGPVLMAMDDDGAQALDCEMGEELMSVENAMRMLEESKVNPITLKQCACALSTLLFSGVVLDILGGVGVGFTCFEPSAVADILCGFSALGLTLGGITTLTGIALPFGFSFYNSNVIEPKNQEKSNFSEELGSLDPESVLTSDQVQRLLELVKGKKAL